MYLDRRRLEMLGSGAAIPINNVIQVCHKRGAPATGGMAASIIEDTRNKAHVQAVIDKVTRYNCVLVHCTCVFH